MVSLELKPMIAVEGMTDMLIRGLAGCGYNYYDYGYPGGGYCGGYGLTQHQHGK